MIGFLLGLWTRCMWLGYAVVEAFIFKVAFNLWVPYFNGLDLFLYKIPEFHLTFLGSFGFFIILYYVGKFIQTIVPQITNIKNSSDSSTDK